MVNLALFVVAEIVETTTRRGLSLASSAVAASVFAFLQQLFWSYCVATNSGKTAC